MVLEVLEVLEAVGEGEVLLSYPEHQLVILPLSLAMSRRSEDLLCAVR